MKVNIAKDDFLSLCKDYNTIPLYTEILADSETPFSIFYKLKDEESQNVLLESAETKENWGRYSFICKGKNLRFYQKDDNYFIKDGDTVIKGVSKPLEALENLYKNFKFYNDKTLGTFCGGFVGYISYDIVKHYHPIEKYTKAQKPGLDIPDIDMIFTDFLIVFDNLKATIKIIKLIRVRNPEEDYEKALKEIEDIIIKLKNSKGASFLDISQKEPDLKEWSSNMTKEEFINIVNICKNYIENGDVIQVVPSQRFHKKIHTNPLNIYRVLRYLNPSPYMYFLDFDNVKIIGSSPETLVKIQDDTVEIRPIAGTIKRGKTQEEDEELAKKLLSDEKEIAEHVMLVDLARNDIGAIAEPGSVYVDNMMHIEKFSHVIHIVSNVYGKKAKQHSIFEVIKHALPAGTLSGAPKVRAMQIIEELEPTKRNIYGGAVGYISLNQNIDFAIAIRTATILDDNLYVQAGAGIVADSIPEKEYLESLSKASSIMKAVSVAEASCEL
ncbi:MAG: anthranilate synthase component I [Hydrogenobaculum sp.]|nr:MAG: anthranilate synthase component I [Hydrogenobaculum sp.]PMP93325.1 MAG: anthranilate synthase component I [Hydrogenobaculum sp.]